MPCKDTIGIPSKTRENPRRVVSSSWGTWDRPTGSTAAFFISINSVFSFSACHAGRSTTMSTSTTPGSRPSAAAVRSTIRRSRTGGVCMPGLPMVTPFASVFHSCQCVPDALYLTR